MMRERHRNQSANSTLPVNDTAGNTNLTSVGTGISIPQSESEDTIDLVRLGSYLLEKWQYLLLVTLFCALIANAYAFFIVSPTYQSTAKLYVVSASGDSVVDLTDLNIGTSLTNDYKELIMSYPVLNQVIEELDLQITSDKLSDMISLTNPTNTRVLSITVTSGNAQLSMNIANTVAGVAQEYLHQTMGTLKPNIAQVARMATQKTSPSFMRYTVLGAALGLILLVGFYVVVFLTNDVIRTADDLERILGIPPLASIPENSAMHLKDDAQYQQGTKKSKGGVNK